MKCNIQKYASVLLTIALTSLLCIGLYCYNNKYIHNTLQPEYGQLTISEIDLEDYHYLIQDWMFYPDILLTPDNFAELSVQTPMIYTAIGERTRFDGLGTREEPHRSGSYYLELYLPKGLRSYALELPEIFSAYRLYINQELNSYLNKVSDTTLSHSNTSIHPFSDNASVDALLQYYYAFAKQNNIHVEFQLVPSKLTLTDIEFCTLLGNLLENAIEACNRLPITAKKQIYLHTRETDYFLFLRVENTYDGLIIEDNHHLLSRKSMSDTHGIGMESVRDIVERHDGTMDIYPMKDVFRIGISLPLKNN